MKHNVLVIAIASLLVGGVATAAYLNNRPDAPKSIDEARPDLARPASASVIRDDDRPADTRIPAPEPLQYADVVAVNPVTRSEKRYGTVIGTEPVRETETRSTPRQVCEDVAVQERLPERDGNVGGTVAGAVIGGLIGNQVGKGDGRKAATAAGAVAGGFIGNRVDRRHEGGRLVTRTERQCHTVTDTTQNSRIVAWNVTYRTPDGHTRSMRTDNKPGSRIPLGSERTVVGYDVTYLYEGRESHVRMAEKPAARLPVVNGQVMARVADAG